MKKMNLLINKFVDTATVKRAVLATLLFSLLTYIIDFSPIGLSGLLKITDGASILDFENSYSLDKAYRMLSQLGKSGRDFWLFRILPVDLFFPMSVMLFFSCWMSCFLKYLTKENSPLRWLVCLPVLDMLCDWGENVGFIAMLVKYPTKLPTVCKISSTITSTKYIALKLVAISFILLLLFVVIKWFQRRVQKTHQ